MPEQIGSLEPFDPISLRVELDQLQKQLEELARSTAAAGQQEAEAHHADGNANLHYGSASAPNDAAAGEAADRHSEASSADRQGRQSMPDEGPHDAELRFHRNHDVSESQSDRPATRADQAGADTWSSEPAPQIGSEAGARAGLAAPRVPVEGVSAADLSETRASPGTHGSSKSAHDADEPRGEPAAEPPATGAQGKRDDDERPDQPDEASKDVPSKIPDGGVNASPPTSGTDGATPEASDHGSDDGDAPSLNDGPDTVAEPPAEIEDPGDDTDVAADGSDPATTMTGTNRNETMVGTSGSDAIDGLGGHDRIFGLEGDDVLLGGAGRDTLDGGAGDDTFVVEGDDRYDDRFIGGEGYDVVRGGEGDDVIRMRRFGPDDGVELIDGGAGTNVVAGTDGNDRIDLSATELRNIAQIDAGGGHDTVTGTAGDDVLIGGAGRDTLDGGAGDDVLIFMEGHGRDHFDGGAGWTDVVRLDLPAEATPGVAWTLDLTSGSIEASGDNYFELTQDSAGVISLASGDEVVFEGLERIEW